MLHARTVFAVFAFTFVLVSAPAQNPGDYRDAVLLKFNLAADGAGCYSWSTPVSTPSMTDNTKTDTSVRTDTTCDDSESRRYSLQVGAQKLVVRPDTGPFHRLDVMDRMMPGAHVSLRFAGKSIKV